MAQLGIVTTCMGRLASLRQTLGRMAAQPGGSCVVVDYSCPERAGDWVEANVPAARVVRVTGRSTFNLAAARNAGAAAVTEPWICFTDADILLHPAFSEAVMPLLRPGVFLKPDEDIEGVHGTVVCAREDFERVGGYDEVFRSWGYEDNDLYDALEFVGVGAETLPPHLLEHLPHGDEERVKFYPERDKRLSAAAHFAYRVIKWDLARIRREIVSPAERTKLYEWVVHEIGRAWHEATERDLTIQFSGWNLEGEWSLVRTLSYQFRRGGGPAADQPGGDP